MRREAGKVFYEGIWIWILFDVSLTGETKLESHTLKIWNGYWGERFGACSSTTTRGTGITRQGKGIFCGASSRTNIWDHRPPQHVQMAYRLQGNAQWTERRRRRWSSFFHIYSWKVSEGLHQQMEQDAKLAQGSERGPRGQKFVQRERWGGSQAG